MFLTFRKCAGSGGGGAAGVMGGQRNDSNASEKKYQSMPGLNAQTGFTEREIPPRRQDRCKKRQQSARTASFRFVSETLLQPAQWPDPSLGLLQVEFAESLQNAPLQSKFIGRIIRFFSFPNPVAIKGKARTGLRYSQAE